MATTAKSPNGGGTAPQEPRNVVEPVAPERRADELLDEALRETFPASDPIAINPG